MRHAELYSKSKASAKSRLRKSKRPLPSARYVGGQNVSSSLCTQLPRGDCDRGADFYGDGSLQHPALSPLLSLGISASESVRFQREVNNWMLSSVGEYSQVVHAKVEKG